MGDFKSVATTSKIRRWVSVGGAEPGDEIALQTWPAIGEGRVVMRWAIDEISDAQDWAREVDAMAQEHANESESNARFRLVHLRHGVPRQELEVRRTPALGSSQIDASPEAYVAQTIAHNEVLLQAAFGGLKYSIDVAQRENDRLRDENNTLRTRIRELEEREMQIADRAYELAIKEAEAFASFQAEPSALEDAVAIGLAESIPQLLPLAKMALAQKFGAMSGAGGAPSE